MVKVIKECLKKGFVGDFFHNPGKGTLRIPLQVDLLKLIGPNFSATNLR